MGDWFKLDASAADALIESIKNYGDTAREVINEEFHGEGADLIKRNITNILPSSGRSWAGKAAPASAAMPGAFAQDNANLEVTIAARGRYHYLYFPDDGSDTVRHAGGQEFMKTGAEESTEEIINEITQKLIERF